jgi:protein-S-isoprenylcysteine O-methyltransferase Ste14
MIGPETAVNGLWLTWFISWWLAARWSARTVVRQSSASRLAHGVFWWAGATLLFAHPALLQSLVHPVFPPSPRAAWAGAALCAAGLAYAWWARIYLGRFWSSVAALKADHALVRNGPYGLTRHPIYTGLLLAVTGTALARDSIAGVLGLAFLLVGIVIKLRQEERLLLDHFGPAYEVYRAEVPALIPGLA